MLNCTYKGESISSYIVKDEKDFDKRKELAIEMRKASRSGALLCEECGHPVEYRNGELRIPYFAHRDGFAHNCNYQEYFKKESKAHKMGKEILYRYFKEIYPSANVRMDYRLENRRRANVYVEQGDQRLAVELERFDIDIQELEHKHKDYKELRIGSLWIICPDLNKTRLYKNESDLHIFKQVLLHELTDMLIFLDVNCETIHILKIIEYRNDSGELVKDKVFIMKYKLTDIIITLNGDIEFKEDTSFYSLYNEAKVAFIEECRAEEERSKSEIEKRQEEEQRKLWEQRLRELEEDREDNNHLYRENEQQDRREEFDTNIDNKRADNGLNRTGKSSYNKNDYGNSYYEPSENELLGKYAFRIGKAKFGDAYSFDYLLKGLHNGPKTFKLIKRASKECIDRKDLKAEELYTRLMKISGFPID